MSTPAEHVETEPGFDLDASLNGIAGKMGLSVPGAEDDEAEPVAAPDDPANPAKDLTPDSTKASADPNAITVRPPPKSWAKEKHELWSKLPADAQEYYETREKQFLDGLEQYKGDAGFAKELRDVLTPYKPMLAAQGVSEKDAVGYLLNAHYRLTNGTADERAAAYRQIGADLGLVEAQAEDPNAPVDPAVKQLADEVRGLKAARTAEDQAKYREAQGRADTETNAFASDPANVYFNEVAPDMVLHVKAGLSLAEAYKKAVWGNPVTREKEIARMQTAAAEKLKADAKTEAESARKATSTNVRSADTRRAPTEPKGTMDDTMRDTLKKIRDRAH